MPQNPRQLTDQDRFDWLRLIRSENVGPVTFWRLLKLYGSASKSLEMIPDLARRGGMKRSIKVSPEDAIASEIKRTEKAGVRLIACGEADYPHLLANISSPPPLISCVGHPVIFQRRMVAIVGARNASAVGNRLASDIARNLGEQDIVLVSGLARGIDTAAHQGSLATGTAAVMAGGIDHIYPPENDALYHNIAKQGVLISELPIGTKPQARDFPRRNRLISGMSLGVLVIEASLKSGSLITARFALEQNREVFAIPGSPLDPRAKGTNQLLRDGATLVENADDVMNVLNGLQPQRLLEPHDESWMSQAEDEGIHLNEQELEVIRVRVTQLLGPVPVSIDELIRQGETSPAYVHTILLELELAGRLERHPGGMVSLIS